MSDAGPILKLTRVSKRFESPDNKTAIAVLEDVSLAVQSCETVAIVGPSGSGKSTLLHILGTLDQPTSGEVLFDGKDLRTLNEAEIAGVRNRKIGFVFQAHYLLPQCTVLENVLVPTLVGNEAFHSSTDGSQRETAQDRAVRLLSRVGLSDRHGHRPGQLSGGERQRVALVRALINQPQLLLADEPTGALDQDSAQRLAQVLVELNQEEKVTLIVVTHARSLAERMRRVFELSKGRLQQIPSP